jgi:hypothetical protein
MFTNDLRISSSFFTYYLFIFFKIFTFEFQNLPIFLFGSVRFHQISKKSATFVNLPGALRVRSKVGEEDDVGE